LVAESYVEVAQTEESDPVAYLTGKVRKLRSLWSSGERDIPIQTEAPGRRQRRTKGTEQRFRALSEFLAALARESDEVAAFRGDVLNNTLLSAGEVSDWITAQPLKRAMLVGIPDGYEFQPEVRAMLMVQMDWAEDIRFEVLNPPLSTLSNEHILGFAPTPCLKYPVPGQQYFQKLPAGHAGIRRKLCNLSRQLSKTFGWHQGQATAFIQTDMTPSITANMVTVGMPPSFALGDDGLDDFYEDDVVQPRWSLIRLIFSIDTILTPREVQHIYGKYRAKLLPRKQRTLSEKHLYLAAISDPSRQAQTDWNQRFPKWKYLKYSQFETAVRTARKRLLTPSGWSLEVFKMENPLGTS